MITLITYTFVTCVPNNSCTPADIKLPSLHYTNTKNNQSSLVSRHRYQHSHEARSM